MDVGLYLKNTIRNGNFLEDDIIIDKKMLEAYFKEELFSGQKLNILKEGLEYLNDLFINEKDGDEYFKDIILNKQEKIKLKAKINNTHSIINSYPIRSNFSLIKNCKFIKVELKEDDFLFIPRGWFHWVETEPNTFAITNEIKYIKPLEDNLFARIMKKGLPFKGKNNIKKNTDYKEIKEKIISFNYIGSVYSEGKDHSPVNKPIDKKKSYIVVEKGIEEILESEKYKEGSFYIIHDSLRLEKFKKYCTIPEIDGIEKNDIIFTTNIWINFDKPITMGMHYDNYDGILSLFSGKKTVYMCHYNNYMKVYLSKTRSLFSSND